MTIDFLNVCWQLKRRIEHEGEKVSQLKNLITSINSEIDGLPKSQDKASKVESLVASIVDGENKISFLRDVWKCCIIELAEKLFELISNATVRQVILYRYGYCKPFKVISTELGFSERRIYNFNSEGLKMLKSFQ